MTDLILKTKKRLRLQGGRMTSQRHLILETLETLDSHPTAEELYNIVSQDDPGIHLSTVYRTLRWLEQEGLVSSRRFAENTRQERFDPMLPADHHHFICTICKRVIEFDDPKIENIKSNFERHFESLVKTAIVDLYGVCSECIEEQNAR